MRGIASKLSGVWEAVGQIRPGVHNPWKAAIPDAAYPAMFSPPFSAVLAKAGLSSPSFTFHSWRHTFRTRLADAGVSDDAARRLGGWTNLGMAAHYDHSKHLPELRAAISAMQSV